MRDSANLLGQLFSPEHRPPLIGLPSRGLPRFFLRSARGFNYPRILRRRDLQDDSPGGVGLRPRGELVCALIRARASGVGFRGSASCGFKTGRYN